MSLMMFDISKLLYTSHTLGTPYLSVFRLQKISYILKYIDLSFYNYDYRFESIGPVSHQISFGLSQGMGSYFKEHYFNDLKWYSINTELQTNQEDTQFLKVTTFYKNCLSYVLHFTDIELRTMVYVLWFIQENSNTVEEAYSHTQQLLGVDNTETMCAINNIYTSLQLLKNRNELRYNGHSDKESCYSLLHNQLNVILEKLFHFLKEHDLITELTKNQHDFNPNGNIIDEYLGGFYDLEYKHGFFILSHKRSGLYYFVSDLPLSIQTRLIDLTKSTISTFLKNSEHYLTVLSNSFVQKLMQ